MKHQKILKITLPLIVVIALSCALSIRWWLSSHVTADIDQLLKEHPITHLGVIMDGNRRWARQHGYKPWIGHQHGIEPVRMVVNFCLQYRIPYLTLYVFSLENFKRPTEEKQFLFEILAQDVAKKTFAELAQNNVRVQFCGDRAQYPASLEGLIQDIEEKTVHNTGLILTLLFCYGGQQELVNAARAVCKEVIIQGESPAVITPERFEKHLWTKHLPPVNLTIRTGYYQRSSNFLLYQAAYSDWYYPACHWPDLTEHHLIEAIRYYAQSTRNCGA